MATPPRPRPLKPFKEYSTARSRTHMWSALKAGKSATHIANDEGVSLSLIWHQQSSKLGTLTSRARAPYHADCSILTLTNTDSRSNHLRVATHSAPVGTYSSVAALDSAHGTPHDAACPSLVGTTPAPSGKGHGLTTHGQAPCKYERRSKATYEYVPTWTL